MRRGTPRRVCGIVLVMLVALVAGATVGTAATTAELSLEPTTDTVNVGSTTTYEIVLSATNDGVGAYNLSVGIGDPSVADIVAAENRIGGNARLRTADDNSSVRIQVSEGNTIDRGSAVVLATVTVRGTATGETEVTLSPSSIRDERGNDQYTVARENDSSLTVNRPVTISGRLLNDDRTAPVANALVVFESADGTIAARTSTTTDGRYAATVPSGTTYTVTVFDRTADGRLAPRNGIADIWTLYRFTPTRDTNQGVDRLPEGNPVTVRVEDRTGRPVQNATLRVYSLFGETRPRTNLSTRTTRNGTLRIRGAATSGLELSGRTLIETDLTSADRQFQSSLLTSTLTASSDQSVLFVATPERVAPDITGDGNPATDPDGDGLFEDVNGDGEATPGDATVLFNAIFSADPGITTNVALFDFNGDGEAAPGDATVLFNETF